MSDLADLIATWLELFGPATTDEIARAHRSRTSSVRDALRNDPRFSETHQGSPYAKVYFVPSSAFRARDGHKKPPTHDERVLSLLSDGKPHSHLELYDLRVVAHSRVSALRRKGHTIECWREGPLYMYRLLPQTGAGFPPSPAPVASLSLERSAA